LGCTDLGEAGREIRLNRSGWRRRGEQTASAIWTGFDVRAKTGDPRCDLFKGIATFFVCLR